MSSDFKNINRDLLEEFIEVYKSQPCLWRVKSKEYHDKSMRDAAYELLLSKFKLIDPSADKDSVIKKINSLRTNYRRERKKVEDSCKSGAGEIYRPTLWYFHLFSFLVDQETPRSSSSSNFKEREEEAAEELNENPLESFKATVWKEEPLETGAHYVPEEPAVESHPRRALGKRLKRKNDKCDSMLESIQRHIKRTKPEEDRHDVFGKYVAVKMRDILSNTQRLLAEKVINDALFMAEMGQLTSHASDNPFGASSSMTIPTFHGFNPPHNFYQNVNPVDVMKSEDSRQSHDSDFSDS